MVEPQPSKLVTWVRFPSPAPPFAFLGQAGAADGDSRTATDGGSTDGGSTGGLVRDAGRARKQPNKATAEQGIETMRKGDRAVPG